MGRSVREEGRTGETSDRPNPVQAGDVFLAGGDCRPRRHAPGGTPTIFLKVRLNAASDS